MDSGVEAGTEITPLYDPMVAKLIVWDVDREKATRRGDSARSRSSRSAGYAR
jgi:acetyl/propionyl-CoA carboxylase alpha subunit